MTDLKTYEVNGSQLFEAKEIIERTGITVTNASVVTRMLSRYAPFAQTAKEWREAGVVLPEEVRGNKRLLTEQQVARYLSHIPYKACPLLHKKFKSVFEYVDQEGDRAFECCGICYEYDTYHSDLMNDLNLDSEYLARVAQAMDCPGMIVDYPLEIEMAHRFATTPYSTKVEVPVFDTIARHAHFYITSEQLTQWIGTNYYGEGTIEMQSKEYEELKKLANAVSEKLECTYTIHVIEKEGATPVTYRDGSYYFEVEMSKYDCPF